MEKQTKGDKSIFGYILKITMIATGVAAVFALIYNGFFSNSDKWINYNDEPQYEASSIERDVDANELELLKYLDIDAFINAIQNDSTYVCYTNDSNCDEIGQIIFAFSPNDSLAYTCKTSYLWGDDDSETADAYICYLPDSGQVAIISLADQNSNLNVGVYNFSYLYTYQMAWIFKPEDLLSNSYVNAYYTQESMCEYPFSYNVQSLMMEYEIENIHISDASLTNVSLDTINTQVIYTTNYNQTAKHYNSSTFESYFGEFVTKDYEVLNAFVSNIYPLDNLYTVKQDSKYYSFTKDDAKFEHQNLIYYVNKDWAYLPYQIDGDGEEKINCLVFVSPDNSSYFYFENFKSVPHDYKKVTGDDFINYCDNLYKDREGYISYDYYSATSGREVVDVKLDIGDSKYCHLFYIKDGDHNALLEVVCLDADINEKYLDLISNLQFE